MADDVVSSAGLQSDHARSGPQGFAVHDARHHGRRSTTARRSTLTAAQVGHDQQAAPTLDLRAAGARGRDGRMRRSAARSSAAPGDAGHDHHVGDVGQRRHHADDHRRSRPRAHARDDRRSGNGERPRRSSRRRSPSTRSPITSSTASSRRSNRRRSSRRASRSSRSMVSISNKDGLLMPGMNGEVTIKAADLSKVIQVPIDAIRATNELAPVARMFGMSGRHARRTSCAAISSATEGNDGHSRALRRRRAARQARTRCD